MLQSLWLSQEEEEAESGVSGTAFAHSVLAQPVALFSYLLSFLMLSFFLFFSFFFLTLLLYQNFRYELTSNLICWGIAEVRSTRAVK